jgi:predicted nucleotidyltransferase
MRTGEVEANLVHLNQSFQLPYIPDLIERKTTGPEKATLEQSDFEFHKVEYDRLTNELEQAFENSRLPEQPRGADSLNDLLVRLRLHTD